jgi:hypothetical protein
LGARNQIRFEIASFDHRHALVIDPTLSYSTLLGGTSDDGATAIAVDSKGYTYITGYTCSSDFPLGPNPYQKVLGGAAGCSSLYGTGSSSNQDVFVTKLNPTGAGLVYSTYLGGSDQDLARGIAVDSLGSA